jgi:hypothetical protein
MGAKFFHSLTLHLKEFYIQSKFLLDLDHEFHQIRRQSNVQLSHIKERYLSCK